MKKKNFIELMHTFKSTLNEICEDIISNDRNSKDDRYKLAHCLTRLLHLNNQLCCLKEFYSDFVPTSWSLRCELDSIVYDYLLYVRILTEKLDYFIDVWDEDAEEKVLDVCAEIIEGRHLK